jgi:hypothetical protein
VLEFPILNPKANTKVTKSIIILRITPDLEICFVILLKKKKFLFMIDSILINLPLSIVMVKNNYCFTNGASFNKTWLF